MGKKDLGLGIGAFILGIASLVYFLELPGNSGYYPKIISAAIIALGAVITLTGWKERKEEEAAKQQPSAPAKHISYKSVALVGVILFIYYFAFQYIGYTIPTCLLMIATSVGLGYKKWKVLIPTAVFVSIGLYLAFTQLFNIRFMGMFF